METSSETEYKVFQTSPTPVTASSLYTPSTSMSSPSSESEDPSVPTILSSFSVFKQEYEETSIPLPKRRRHHSVCAVSFCPSPEYTSYHSFPKDPALLRRWLSFCKRNDNVNPKTARICSNHFSPECFDRDLRNELLGLQPRTLLRKGSIPSTTSTLGETTVSERGKSLRKKEIQEIIQPLLSGPLDYTIIVDTSVAGNVAVQCNMFSEKEETLDLKEKICSLQKELSHSKDEISNLKKEVRHLNSKKYKREYLQSVLQKTQSPVQIKRILHPERKRFHYDGEEIMRAALLKTMSPKMYEYLRKTNTLPLPSRQILDAWAKDQAESQKDPLLINSTQDTS